MFNTVYSLYASGRLEGIEQPDIELRSSVRSSVASAERRRPAGKYESGDGRHRARRESRHPQRHRKFNQSQRAAYNPAIASAASGISFVNLGTSNISSFSKDDFTPRIGLAYRLSGNDKLVLRTGFGIFINDLLGQYGQSGWNSFPYFVSQTFNGNATTPNLNIANPFAGSGASTISPQAIMPNWKSSYIKSYNFGIQASPFRNVLLDIGYVGSDSTHLPATLNINQPLPAPTGSVASRRPYPQYGNISYTDDSATANYNHCKRARRSAIPPGWRSSWHTPGPNPWTR